MKGHYIIYSTYIIHVSEAVYYTMYTKAISLTIICAFETVASIHLLEATVNEKDRMTQANNKKDKNRVDEIKS